MRDVAKILADKIKVYDFKDVILRPGKKRFCALIECDNCHVKHYKDCWELERGLGRNKRFFCSLKCHSEYHQTKIKVSCANCNKEFYKLPNQIKKTKNNFCSKSCAATFNNKNKEYGIRRSRIEKITEEMIKLKFPDLIYYCNNKSIIGSELDFYFPDLKIAIQMNGPTHYKPIYGQEKFNQIQRTDEEKRNACLRYNIKLFEMDYSEDKYLNKNKIQERLSEIIDIICREGGIRIHET